MSWLVYCCATIQEIQRLSCVAPASLAHTATKDVEVKGYKIETGTRIAANLTKFMKDPEVFPNPESLMPERFIESGSCGNANSKQTLKVVEGAQINNALPVPLKYNFQ